MFKVAIVIPTMRRIEFVIRQLEFYKISHSKHPIYIGDSSNYKTNLELKRKVLEYKNDLEIYFYYLPNKNNREVNKFLAEKSKEKYY